MPVEPSPQKRSERVSNFWISFSVTFFKERNQTLWRYDICSVPLGGEPMISAALEGISTKYRMMVFILEKPEQQKSLFIPCEHCFTWKDNGEYRFYK